MKIKVVKNLNMFQNFDSVEIVNIKIGDHPAFSRRNLLNSEETFVFIPNSMKEFKDAFDKLDKSFFTEQNKTVLKNAIYLACKNMTLTKLERNVCQNHFMKDLNTKLNDGVSK